MALASPRRKGLLRIHDLLGGAFGASRSLFSVAVGDIAAAVRRAAGADAYARIR